MWKSRVPKITCQGRICCEATKELGQHRQWWVQNTAVQYNCICFAPALPGEHTNTLEGYNISVVDVTYIEKSDLASLVCNTNIHYSEHSQISYCSQKIQDQLCYGYMLPPLLTCAEPTLTHVESCQGAGTHPHRKVKFSKNVKPVLLNNNTKITPVPPRRKCISACFPSNWDKSASAITCLHP